MLTVNNEAKSARGQMTSSEAGRMGGELTRDRYGVEFFEKIGRKGGQRMRELIKRGKDALAAEELAAQTSEAPD